VRAPRAPLVLWGVLAPAWAWACPMCAGRSDSHRWATYSLLAAFISVPYLLGGVVLRIVRRLDT